MINYTNTIVLYLWKLWPITAIGVTVAIIMFAILSLPDLNIVNQKILLPIVLAAFTYHFFVAGCAREIIKKGNLQAMSVFTRYIAIFNFYGFALLFPLYVLFWLYPNGFFG